MELNKDFTVIMLNKESGHAEYAQDMGSDSFRWVSNYSEKSLYTKEKAKGIALGFSAFLKKSIPDSHGKFCISILKVK